jgi:hypothetical protein
MPNRQRLWGIATIVSFILILIDSRVVVQSTTRSAMANAKSLKCIFPVNSTGTWIENTPQAEIKTAKLTLEYQSIDTEDGTADVRGTSGPPHITVRLSGGYLHFLHMASEGPLYVTTVFDQPTSAGRLRAVHTRHEYTRVSLPGFTSRPEQYYGECEIRP